MVTGSTQTKHKRYYSCLNIYPIEAAGMRKPKWIPTGLSERGNKRKADHITDQLKQLFNRDGTLIDKYAFSYNPIERIAADYPELPEITLISLRDQFGGKMPGENAPIETALQQAKNMLLIDGDKPETIRKMRFCDYLILWLERTAPNLDIGTYGSYRGVIYGRTYRFFDSLDVSVEDLLPGHIEEFYRFLSFKENGKTSAKEFLHRLLAMINDTNVIPLSPKMIGIIDACNKRYHGSFDPERYLNLLQEIINENKRISSVKEDMPFVDYLIYWLKSKRNLQLLTYEGYKQMITGRITEFFGAKGSSLDNLNSEDFDEYYDYLRFQCGLTECTALHHHRMMKQALSYGVKKGLLSCNVMDKVDAPGDSDFQGDYYRPDEAKRLLERAKADPLYIVIVLTVYYGFRRSEVLGLRWSAVNFHTNIIHIERKVISLSQNGHIEYQDEAKMKSKSGSRSLPLIPVVKEALLQEKARQELFREQFEKSYCKNENGYICVDALGHLLTPDYVTRHFEVLLKKNHLRRIRFHDLRHPYVKPKTKKFAYFSQFSFRLRNCSLSSLSAAAKNACSFSFSSGNRHPKVLPPILQ